MADIDIGQISEALNDKTDRDFNNMNPSALSKETVVSWGIPDYSAGVSKTWNTDTTASTDCFVYVLANSSLNNNICRLTVDGIVVFNDLNSGSDSPRTSGIIPVQKGSIYKATSSAGGTLIEYPLKGVK